MKTAPWTDEQVKNLTEFQKCCAVHPFTCGGTNCHADLVATNEGWVCPKGCGYTQNWAHSFMLDGSCVKELRESGVLWKIQQINKENSDAQIP